MRLNSEKKLKRRRKRKSRPKVELLRMLHLIPLLVVQVLHRLPPILTL
jgi:hypothetical protein